MSLLLLLTGAKVATTQRGEQHPEMPPMRQRRPRPEQFDREPDDEATTVVALYLRRRFRI